jgi:hypothetical protein
MKVQVLKNLKNNHWSFELIYPLFAAAFKGQGPLWQRTAVFYGLGEGKEQVVKGVDNALSLSAMPEVLQEEYTATLLIFRATHPQLWPWYTKIVSEIAFVTGDLVAGTSPKAFGLLFLSSAFFAKTMDERIECLVHELIHCELYLINVLDPLFTAASHAHYAYAINAGKDRPVHGRFHAAYVFYRLINQGIFPIKNQTLLTHTLATLQREHFTEFGKNVFEIVSGEQSREKVVARGRKINPAIFKSPDYGCQRFIAV